MRESERERELRECERKRERGVQVRERASAREGREE
jgi:hypothetical protein